jgi:hypothetical protein
MDYSSRNILNLAYKRRIEARAQAGFQLSECAPQLQSPFCRLPAELRLQIYEAVLTQDCRGFVCDDITSSWSLKMQCPDLSLLYTCRSVFAEASWIPLATTTHYFRCVKEAGYYTPSTPRIDSLYMSDRKNELHVVSQFNKLRLTANNIATLNRVVLNGPATDAEPFRALCMLSEFQPKHVTVEGSCMALSLAAKTVIGLRRVERFSPLPDSVHTFILSSFVYHEENADDEARADPKAFALPILTELSLSTRNQETLSPKTEDAVTFGDYFYQKGKDQIYVAPTHTIHIKWGWRICRFKVCFTK